MYNTMCKKQTKQKAEPQAESFCCRHFSFSKHDDDTVDTLHSNWLSDCQRHASAFICSQRYESLSHLFPLSSEYLHWLFFVCLGGGWQYCLFLVLSGSTKSCFSSCLKDLPKLNSMLSNQILTLHGTTSVTLRNIGSQF